MRIIYGYSSVHNVQKIEMLERAHGPPKTFVDFFNNLILLSQWSNDPHMAVPSQCSNVNDH